MININTEGYYHNFKYENNVLVIDFYNYDNYLVCSISIVINDIEKSNLINILNI